jgi:hypothetical protein
MYPKRKLQGPMNVYECSDPFCHSMLAFQHCAPLPRVLEELEPRARPIPLQGHILGIPVPHTQKQIRQLCWPSHESSRCSSLSEPQRTYRQVEGLLSTTAPPACLSLSL